MGFASLRLTVGFSGSGIFGGTDGICVIEGGKAGGPLAAGGGGGGW